MSKILTKITDLLKAATPTTSGLAVAGALPGLATGGSIAAGNIGEIVTPYVSNVLGNFGTATKDAFVDLTGATLTLQPGIWQVSATVYMQISTSGGGSGDGLIAELAIRTGSTTVKSIPICVSNVNLVQAFGGVICTAIVSINTATTYKISSYARTISAVITLTGLLARGDFQPTTLSAVRIA